MPELFTALGDYRIPFPVIVIASAALFALVGWLLTLLEKYVFSGFVFFAYLWLGAFAVLSAWWFVSAYQEQYADLAGDGVLSRSPLGVLSEAFKKAEAYVEEAVGAPVQGFINGVSARADIMAAGICLGALFLAVWVVLMLPLIDLVFNMKTTVEDVVKHYEEREAEWISSGRRSLEQMHVQEMEARIARLEQMQSKAVGSSSPHDGTGLKLNPQRPKRKG